MDLEFEEVQNLESPMEGKLRKAPQIIVEDYWKPSGLLGINYLVMIKIKSQFCITLERFLPIGAESPVSIESISFHAYR